MTAVVWMWAFGAEKVVERIKKTVARKEAARNVDVTEATKEIRMCFNTSC